jgi:hypothetical protein
MKIKWVYSIPSSCGRIYIGEIGCLIEAKTKEHYAHINEKCVERLALV